MLFSPDCDALGNGAGMALPGKGTLRRKTIRVSMIINYQKHVKGEGVRRDTMIDKPPRYPWTYVEISMILTTFFRCGYLNALTALTPILKYFLFIFFSEGRDG